MLFWAFEFGGAIVGAIVGSGFGSIGTGGFIGLLFGGFSYILFFKKAPVSNPPLVNPDVQLVWSSPPGEGFQLEITCVMGTQGYNIASFVADSADESLSLELNVGDSRIRIPLAVLEDAIQAAKKDVHSEAWYDRQPDSEAGI